MIPLLLAGAAAVAGGVLWWSANENKPPRFKDEDEPGKWLLIAAVLGVGALVVLVVMRRR